jgi:hypothetical protein
VGEDNVDWVQVDARLQADRDPIQEVTCRLACRLRCERGGQKTASLRFEPSESGAKVQRSHEIRLELHSDIFDEIRRLA